MTPLLQHISKSQRVLRVPLVLFLLAIALCRSTVAEDDLQTRLEQQRFPWYDAETGDFKPLDVPREARTPKSPQAGTGWMSRFLSSGMYALMWVIVSVLVIGLIALLVRTLRDSSAPPSEQAAEPIGVKVERLDLLPEMTHGVTDFLSKAEEYAIAGDYARAMIFYYAWQLKTLGKKEIVLLEAGKTNARYIREVANRCPDLRPLILKSVRCFEDAIYGGYAISQDKFQSLWTRKSDFENAIPRARADDSRRPRSRRSS